MVRKSEGNQADLGNNEQNTEHPEADTSRLNCEREMTQ